MSYQQQFHRWLHSDALSPEEKAQLQAIADDPKEVEDRFFGLLEFGTAGLRGVMGLGLRRMNVHVIRHATQAFAQVILAEGPAAAAQGVAICYDCRVHSQDFARAAAGVMAANGIPVRLFEAMRPTPELSLQGLLVRRRPAAPPARGGHRRPDGGPGCLRRCQDHGLRTGPGPGAHHPAGPGDR